MVVYFARPEDWIPGLAAVPLAKITGIVILLALVLSVGNIRWHMPREIIFLILLVVQLWLSAVFSPVWRGGAFNVMLDFSKVLPLVVVIYAAVRSMKRLSWILFVQAASVAAIAVVSVVNAHILRGRLQGALSGMYGNPNDLALIIDISLPLCLVLALTSGRVWKKIVWTAAMLAMAYAVVLTASRGRRDFVCSCRDDLPLAFWRKKQAFLSSAFSSRRGRSFLAICGEDSRPAF